MHITRKRIRKYENWKIRVSDVGYLQSILFIFMPLLFWSVFIVWIIKSGESIIPLYIISIILLIFVYFWVRMCMREHNIIKAKKFKKNGWWIIKKVKITSIQHYYKSWYDDTKWFDWYYLEAKEWDIIYCSDAFEWWRYAWLPYEVFQDIYNTYWYEFDEKQTHRNDVLKKIDMKILDKQWVNSGWYIREMWLSVLNKQRKIVEKWYKTPYFQINNHEISIWDSVDVYIDPENEENYRMDTDFLFDE